MNEIFRFNEFALEKPSPQDFVPPSCYDLANPIYTGQKPTLPSSFTSVVNQGGGRVTTTYQHAGLNAKADKKTFKGLNGESFSWIIVQSNGTRYAYTDFFKNIQPFPCFGTYATVFQWPSFSRAGSLQAGPGLPYDLYYGSDHRLWAFKNNSIPIAALDTDFPIAEYTSFSAQPPPPNIFQLPSLCFSATPMKKRSSSSVSAFPVFPSAYTMYLTYYDTFGESSGKLVVYFDATKNSSRVDTPYKTYIQKQNNVYSFINPMASFVGGISPLPCYALLNRSYTVWANPQFERFLGNVTVNGKPAKVLLDNRLDSEVVHFWYLATDNTPLFFVAASTINSVDYFQAVPPPAGVFDVPSTCVTITTKNRFSLFEEISLNGKRSI
jgi:hypothetical protein